MRIVILTYESPQSNYLTQHLLTEFPDQVAGIMQSDVTIAGKNNWQTGWFLLRQTGLGFVLPKAMEILLSRWANVLYQGKLLSNPIVTLPSLVDQFDIPLAHTKRVNGPTALQKIQSWQPSLLISIYFNQRLRPRLLKVAPHGAINIHPALLPKHRGLFPYFWALADGDDETGVTIHWVDPQFDTGDILCQQSLIIEKTDTLVSLARRSAELGADLLVQAVRDIKAGAALRLPQNHHQASYHSWPTAADIKRFKQQGRRYGSFQEIWQDIIN